MYSVENPPHSQLSTPIKSEGEQYFFLGHWKEHNAFKSTEKSSLWNCFYTPKETPELGGGTFLVISIWNLDTLVRIASNSIKTIHVSITCPVTFLAQHWDEKRETLDKGGDFWSS